MHLLYCDESNLEDRAGDFLIYAGLVIPPDASASLSAAVEDLRRVARVPPDYRLKFNPGPANLNHEQFATLKQRVLEAAVHHGAHLLAYVVLHDIAGDPDLARRNGINVICYHFHCLLERANGNGLALIDRFNDAGNAIEGHLRDKFGTGLVGMPFGNMRLPRILGFHYSTIGQAHFPSIVDIAIGSLRYAINSHTRGEAGKAERARALLALLSPLLFREHGEARVPEIGFTFSPKAVKVQKYREQYESLKEYLQQCGIETTQSIRTERWY